MTGSLGQLLSHARASDGLFTSSEAAAAGLSRQALERAERAGLISRVGRGVYAGAGVPVTWRQRVRAAVMAARPHGAAARVTALRLHGLVSGEPAIHVLVPYGCEVRRAGEARIHRSRTFAPGDRVAVAGIAVTSVARSLVESWSAFGERRWLEVTAAALRDNAVDRGTLLEQLDAMGAVTGASRMRRALAGRPRELDRARSAAEERLPDLLDAAGYGRTVLNHEVIDERGHLIAELDAAVPDLRIGFELDSRTWHSLPGQVAKDAMKDLRLAAIGWRVHRLPLRLVVDHPQHALRLLRSLRSSTP